MKYILGTLASCILLLFIASCSSTPKYPLENSNMETVQYKKIEGVDDERLQLDVHNFDKSETDRPVLVWVHGGAWWLGDKQGQIRNLMNVAMKNDWILVAMNYRLSPRPKLIKAFLDEDRVMHPDHSEDIADAIAWTYKNIKNYGGNPNNMVLIGHSAGAHLVSLTATKQTGLTERGVPMSAIKGVASIDVNLYNVRPFVEEGSPMIVSAFGTDIDMNNDASPLFHVKEGNKTFPDFLVATRGSDERKANAVEFVDALKAAGTKVTLIDGSEYSHLEVGDAIGEPEEKTMTVPVEHFIKESFAK